MTGNRGQLTDINHRTASLRTSAFTTQNSTALVGGAGRDRTDGLLLAKQALSQLSYGPLLLPVARYRSGGSGWTRTIDPRLIKTVL